MVVRVRSATAAIAAWAAHRGRRGRRGAKHGKITHKTNFWRAPISRAGAYRNLRTRSHGYLKLDIPARRSCASWSINSSPRRPSCVRNISRSSCKSTNRRGGESIDATGDGRLARKLHRGRVTRDAGSIAYLEYRGRGEFPPPVRRKFVRFLVSSYRNSEPTRMRISGNRRQYQLAPARSPE